jgi:hypothetical protein
MPSISHPILTQGPLHPQATQAISPRDRDPLNSPTSNTNSKVQFISSPMQPLSTLPTSTEHLLTVGQARAQIQDALHRLSAEDVTLVKNWLRNEVLFAFLC